MYMPSFPFYNDSWVSGIGCPAFTGAGGTISSPLVVIFGLMSVTNMSALVQRAAGNWGGWPRCGLAVTVSGVPFKHNAARRHRIPYPSGDDRRNHQSDRDTLKNAGGLTIWVQRCRFPCRLRS